MRLRRATGPRTQESRCGKKTTSRQTSTSVSGTLRKRESAGCFGLIGVSFVSRRPGRKWPCEASCVAETRRLFCSGNRIRRFLPVKITSDQLSDFADVSPAPVPRRPSANSPRQFQALSDVPTRHSVVTPRVCPSVLPLRPMAADSSLPLSTRSVRCGSSVLNCPRRVFA